MYHERRSAVPGVVVWTRLDDRDARILPDGCTDVIWDGTDLVVAGPDTRSHEVPPAVAPLLGLRFAPGVGPAILGLPASELRDDRVRLDELWANTEVRLLRAQLGEADVQHPGRFGEPCRTMASSILEAHVAARLASTPPSPLMTAVAGELAAGRRVDEVAERAGMSARTLHRHSLDAFGYGPKLLARVLRMQRALALARSGLALAMTAALCGYADQAHLARDVRELAGVTLGSLTRPS